MTVLCTVIGVYVVPASQRAEFKGKGCVNNENEVGVPPHPWSCREISGLWIKAQDPTGTETGGTHSHSGPSRWVLSAA